MSDNTDIAIIGMAGRYPQASSPWELWKHIVRGVDLSTGDGSTASGRVNRHFEVAGIDLFDNEFFGLSPYESRIMDPQHRIMLTCAYRAMEDAGYEKTPAGTRVGVFASTSVSTYLINVVLRSKYFEPGELNYKILLGNDKDSLATRIAYKLNLTGPAVTVQCACSSSLVAVHLACQSLVCGDCDIAIVGAVSITVPQGGGYSYQEGGILARDGICRPFDRDATGTIKGNGCSAVVLRRLSEAINEGERILAIVKGTAINNDGAEKIGFTAPSISGQQTVLSEARSFAGVATDDIQYVEAHGTGTNLGDQIELTALAASFAGARTRIPVGSLKANIGHLDVAAGLTSMIKGVMVIQHGTVPAITNLQHANAAVRGATEVFEFPTRNSFRRVDNVAVSSFGIGGTNAHAIISRHEGAVVISRRSLRTYLIPMYLNRRADLRAYCASVIAQLKNGAALRDLAPTLALRRKRRAVVLCLVADDEAELARQLEQLTHVPVDTRAVIPRFTRAALEDLRRSLPCLAPRSGDAEGDAGHPADSLVRWLARTGVLSVPAVAAANGISPRNLAAVEAPADVASVRHLVWDESVGERDAHVALRLLLQFVGRVHTLTELDLFSLYEGTGWKPLALPPYPLDESRHWIDLDTSGPHSEDAARPETRPALSDDDVLADIIKIWIEAIGDDQVAPDSTFPDVGADSLTAIDIIDRINRRFGAAIPVTAALNQLTPETLAAQVLGRELRSSAPWVSYIRYRRGDAKTIFLIHPAGGSTLCYSALSRHLASDFNICAIDLPEGFARYDSLTALACRYAQEIRSYQANGPYLVGGYSFGGNVAHEVARQLEQDGAAVEAVVMFDSHPPESYNSYDGTDVDYVGAFPTLVASYFKPDLVEVAEQESRGVTTLDAAVDVVRRLGILRPSISAADVARFYERWVFNHDLLKKHRPASTVEAGLIMFVAKDQEPPILLEKLKIRAEAKDRWRHHVNGPVRSVLVDGDHFTMFGKANHAKALAKAFDAVMEDFTTATVE